MVAHLKEGSRVLSAQIRKLILNFHDSIKTLPRKLLKNLHYNTTTCFDDDVVVVI